MISFLTCELQFLIMIYISFKQKLEKANEDVKETATVKQSEIDMLKSTCDRLSANSTKKETELQNISDQVQQVELQVNDLSVGYKLSRVKS